VVIKDIRDTLGDGISYHPGGAIMSDSGTVMFGEDSESDEDRGDESSASGKISGPILMSTLSKNVPEHESSGEFGMELVDEEDETFRLPFDRMIRLSQAEKDHAEIRANGLHGHEHDPPTPSSTSTQEPSSPPPDTPRGETPPLPRQFAGLAKQKQLSTVADAAQEFPTTAVESYLGANGEPLKG